MVTKLTRSDDILATEAHYLNCSHIWLFITDFHVFCEALRKITPDDTVLEAEIFGRFGTHDHWGENVWINRLALGLEEAGPV